MHLQKWINLKYLYQNFKKSKSLFIFILCIVPFINLWIVGTNIISRNYIIDFNELSKVSVVIAFILSVIVAFLLFGFVFKRNTVDFIMSKPITRKQIFASNIFGGIVYILLIILLNSIGFLLISFLTDLFIPFGAILDYFIYFLVTYIFVFIISVLAISLSGNIMGFIIIILLLLLLYPSLTFIEYKTRSDNLDTYYLCESEECMPTIEYCGDDNNCLKEIESGKYHYRVIQKYNSTLTTPINYFNEGFNTKSIIKTIILSVVYLVIGYFIFKNRRMENSEVSFKNKYLYKTIKILSYIPITYLAYMFYSSDKSFLLIAIIICFVYYFMYDLILQKTLGNIVKTIGEMLIVSIIFIGAYFILEHIYSSKDQVLSIPDEATINYTDPKLQYNYDIVVSDKNLINELIKANNIDEWNGITIIFDNKHYMTQGISNELLEKLDEYATKNNLKDTFTTENILHITSSLNPGFVLPDSNNFKNKIVDYLNSYEKSNESIDIFITLYKYENHEIKELALNVSGNLELFNYVKNIYNEEFLENINDSSVYVSDEAIAQDFVNVFNKNKEDFIEFLQKHKNDELTSNIIVLYSNLDRYYINREEFLMEYDKYVANN